MKLYFQFNELFQFKQHPDKGLYPCCWTLVSAIGLEYLPTTQKDWSIMYKKL